MSEIAIRRVFVAAPSDASAERALLQMCVEQVNTELAVELRIGFELCDWSQVDASALAHRPQAAINALVNECDYLVALFRNRWGSPTGSEMGFTSGTEEEIFVALLALSDNTSPMANVWLAFLDADGVRDPKIDEFKSTVERAKSVTFAHLPNHPSLVERFTARLRGWAKDGPKVARSVDLVPMNGRDVLRADRLRVRGTQLVGLGDVEDGYRALAEAVAIGGVPEKLEFARVLARRNEIGEASKLVDAGINDLKAATEDLRTVSLAEALDFRAYLEIRAQRPFEAKSLLLPALEWVETTDRYSRGVRSRILDRLATACSALGDKDQARKYYLEALGLRENDGSSLDLAQSHVNLVRLALDEGDSTDALEHAEAALGLIENLSPSSIHPNAYLAHAQVCLERGDASKSAESASRALVLNRQLGNSRGEAMALGVEAQSRFALGDHNGARDLARASVALDAAIGLECPAHILEIAGLGS